MSSPYLGPASLPSSYDILSRSEQDHEHERNSDSNPEEGVNYGPPPTKTVTPRRSYPHIPHTKSLKGSSNPTEATPLLVSKDRPVSLIEEQIESKDHESTLTLLKEEMKILTTYSLPIFGSQLLEYTLVIASVVSIGHLSTTALAGVSLGSMTASVTAFSIIQGLVSALDTMLPSAWTSQDPRLVGLWAQRMTVVIAFSLIPMYFIWFNAEQILINLKQDPDVAHLAAVYLRWVSLGLPAYAFNCISRRYFQSQGLFTIPTRIVLFAAPVNVILNYLLVWGPAPIRLGYIGAPIATAISFNLISIASIIYGVFFAPTTAWHPISKRMFTNLGVLVQLGLGGVGQTATEWWAWELISLAASLLGPVALATQSILVVSGTMAFQAPFALGIATSVRIGNLLGERKARRAQTASNAAILMGLIIATCLSTMFIVFRDRWAYMFNNDPEVVSLVRKILPILALFQIFDSNAAVTAGILRAKGWQFVGALLNISAYYILGLPLGVFLAFKCHIGLPGLSMGLTTSLIYCAAFSTYFCVRTDWNREVDKVMERMSREESKGYGSIENGHGLCK
ncbi:MATE efflux family protein [Amanita muscaria]